MPCDYTLTEWTTDAPRWRGHVPPERATLSDGHGSGLHLIVRRYIDRDAYIARVTTLGGGRVEQVPREFATEAEAKAAVIAYGRERADRINGWA